ncbi:two component transcriptional regulator, LytTR family [Fibrisoma limi BUZ 3]|uniref:Two component transcriptional regulator, LytTR family n=1 Tax=Fibrisoma limi BUZ 3 TaxID=1185876 RepID=I2GJU5_9BACT|nr:LytTR family DNA-binding domain-containing protein [Fibrisoma limi]CCH54170.1 two component transcriptional regulator, LytTR family [Fibrisoma limi BUZ 3]
MTGIYRDRWLIIAGSLLSGYFFVNIGQEESVFALWNQSFYLRDIVGASLITAAVWLVVRTITVWLDGRYDWFAQPAKRILGQLVLGVIGPVVVSLLLTMLYFYYVVKQPIAESTYPVYEFPISVLVIVLINLVYVGLYLYRKATVPVPPHPEPASQTPEPTFRKTLIVNSGLRNVPVSIDDVAYIYIDEATIFLTTFSGGKYVVNTSLDELARDLPEHAFFRVNRQFIINRKACSSYLNDTYGKLKVELRPTLPKDIIVSQQKAPDFKKWLEDSL